MKVLLIKLPDETYNDLKFLKKAGNISMADFIRQEIEKPLQKETRRLKARAKKQDPLDHMLSHSVSGKDYLPHLTNDEILYGCTDNQKGEKVWPKKPKKS